MSFFDELTQKAKTVAGNVSEKAKEASEKAKEVADSAKISAAIMAEKRELDKRYREIGQWYANEYAQEDIPEAIADGMKAVRDSQEKIAALQAEREKAETEEAIAAEEGKVCPVCGKISDARFCPHCGAPLVEAHQASKEEIAAQQEAESQAAGEEA